MRKPEKSESPPVRARVSRRVLVIGYGNTLRGDDAVGPRVAAAVAGWREARIGSQSCPQLTPELAEAVAQVELVIFVDAAVGRTALVVEQLLPNPDDVNLVHHASPAGLLDLARTVYGKQPEAWLVGIPAARFDMGAGLSPSCTRYLAPALQVIRTLAG